MVALKRNRASELTRERAVELRRDSTHAENKLWRALRAYRADVKFRRQHPVGPYIVDFYCPDLGLVVEVDGPSHFTEEGIQHDRVREEYLRSCGLTIKRYTNIQVFNSLDWIVADIFNSTEQRIP